MMSKIVYPEVGEIHNFWVVRKVRGPESLEDGEDGVDL